MMIYRHQNWISACLVLYTSVVSSLHTSVSYDDLIDMNIACGDLDHCQAKRRTDDLRVVNCQCGPSCAQLGTCCVDSRHRGSRVSNRGSFVTPLQPYGSVEVAFMVNRCKPDWEGDDSIKDLCEADITTRYKDPFLLLPVTNLRSGISYSNYYCFACNKENVFDIPVLWDFKLFSNQLFPVASFPDLKWDHGSFIVNGHLAHIAATPPQDISSLVQWYRPDVIGYCAEGWTDTATRAKCEAYTALVYFVRQHRSPIYRNPHCAICNNVSVSQLVCMEPTGNEQWGGPPYGYQFVGLFATEDELGRCLWNEVFDKFSNKCRPFRCGRNQKLVNMKCVESSGISRNTNNDNPIGFQWATLSEPSTVRESPGITETSSPTDNSSTTRNQGGVNLDSTIGLAQSSERPETHLQTEAPPTSTLNLGGVRLFSGPRFSTGRHRPQTPIRTQTRS